MKLSLTLFITCLCLVASAQSDDAARRRNFNLDLGVALKGFDPVSYFNGKPAKGDSKISYDYRGITYYFANDANLQQFKKASTKYEPAYGGWCAYTVGKTGERVKVSLMDYKITNGKLYLFYNFNGDNRLLKWNKDEKKLKTAADRNWVAKMH